MLSKAVIFVFCFLGIFSLLFFSMPASLMENQASYNPTYFRTDAQVAEFFSLNNITLYSAQASDNLTKDEHNRDYSAGLPAGSKLDIWWDNDYLGGSPPYALGISYETQHFLFGGIEYWTFERLHFITPSGENGGDLISKEGLELAFSSNLNGSFFNARCNSGIQVTIVYSGYNATIGDSWDYGLLHFMLSYELNATASSVNMFTLLGQILTFQAPRLGISGWFGDLLNNLIAIPIYAIAGFIIYKLITGIAPWLSGGSGD